LVPPADPGRATVLLGAARRIALLFVAIVVGSGVVAGAIGVASGHGLLRSIAVGLYVAGACLLVGCFVMGARGPLRGVGASGETTGALGARGVRRATSEERSDAARTSLLLFGLAIGAIVIAALIDPAHPVF
jgi:hypothetical protein